jgi:hypothetical protein
LKRKDANFGEEKIANYVSELREVFKDDEDPDFVRIVTTYTTGGHVLLTVSAGMRRILEDNHSPEKTIYNTEMDDYY